MRSESPSLLWRGVWDSWVAYLEAAVSRSVMIPSQKRRSFYNASAETVRLLIKNLSHDRCDAVEMLGLTITFKTALKHLNHTGTFILGVVALFGVPRTNSTTNINDPAAPLSFFRLFFKRGS